MTKFLVRLVKQVQHDSISLIWCKLVHNSPLSAMVKSVNLCYNILLYHILFIKERSVYVKSYFK